LEKAKITAAVPPVFLKKHVSVFLSQYSIAAVTVSGDCNYSILITGNCMVSYVGATV
jgi:hypothetical protein